MFKKTKTRYINDKQTNGKIVAICDSIQNYTIPKVAEKISQKPIPNSFHVTSTKIFLKNASNVMSIESNYGSVYDTSYFANLVSEVHEKGINVR